MEVSLSGLTKPDIEAYLAEVKDAVRKGRYRIELNENRKGNRDLSIQYLIREEQKREIILSLMPEDFSEAGPNEYIGYEHEILYVFGKTVPLLERFGDGEKLVELYIKFNKLENKRYVIVISFHEAEKPVKKYFT